MSAPVSLDLAYVGGFFDGEGSLGVYRGKPQGGPLLVVSLYQSHSEPADFLMECMHERWGGVLDQARGGRGYLLRLHGNAARYMLQEILPHLRIKREQAQVAIDWQRDRPNQVRGNRGHGGYLRYPTERKAQDDAIMQKLRDLKKVQVAAS